MKVENHMNCVMHVSARGFLLLIYFLNMYIHDYTYIKGVEVRKNKIKIIPWNAN